MHGLGYNASEQSCRKYPMKTRLGFRSLRNKIILSIVVVTALCAVVSGVIVYVIVQYEMTNRYGADKEAAIESLSYSLQPVLDSRDYQGVSRIIASALIFEHVAFVAVFDGSGTQIDSQTKNDVAPQVFTRELHKITVDGKTIGSFAIGFSRQYINDLARRTTLVLVVALVAFLFLAGLALFIFMGRSVVQPIESFTRTIGRIGPDNLSTRMDVRATDEIGLLATSFNRMAGDLENSHNALQAARNELEQKVEARTRGERRRSDQLRAINELGRRISAILSLDELLPYLANSLQQTFNYSVVSIFLLDSSQEGVVLKAGAGGHGEAIPLGFMARLGEGIVGMVAKSGEPWNVGDVASEPGYVPSREIADTRAEIAVPIKLGASTFGVLDVQSTTLDAFDEIDLFTVQTLGDQLAIAIENARLYQESRDVAVIEERNRMAREIHDTLAQGFTGIVLQLEAAEQALAEDNKDAQQHLDRARALAKESLKAARRSVWALRPRELEQLPLVAAIRREIEQFTQDTGVRASLNTAGDSRNPSAEIENALLRICQEALTNVRRHAQASRVEIGLAFDEGGVRLSIDDDGAGFDPDARIEDRFGLISMGERAKLLGGALIVSSEKGKGTHLEVTIPRDRGTA
jgi:signal transduction histidine kinase